MTSQVEQTERRKYIRLNVVFPVEFQFLDTVTGEPICKLKQGFTRDVGKGGICLEINDIEGPLENILKEHKAKVDLSIHIPLNRRRTKAVASISWYKKIEEGDSTKYIAGLSFLQIDPRDRDRIYFHARKISLAPKFVAILVLALAIGLLYFYSSDFKSRRENRLLVQELVEISSEKSGLENDIFRFYAERREKEKELLENEKKIEGYKERLKQLEELIVTLKEDKLKNALSEKAKLAKKAASLSKESEYLKDRITALSKDTVSVEDRLKKLLPSFEEVEKKSISSMYRWIKNHQNRRTGLVVSYEGDKKVEDWSFTYDQSLASQCFILIGDKNNAKEILSFYKGKAEKKEGAFANAYDAHTGKIVEYSVHAGPNIWLGIAMLQYTNRFKDEEYLSTAKYIGDWLVLLQKEDKDFGIKGGPRFEWFSTEHNLDAFAFFGMLHKITKETKYLDAQEKSLQWLKKYAFSSKEGRLNRGKGDATIATDTFAWAIAALGPEVLKESNMDPDQIMDFAEENCLVKVDYARPDNKNLKVTGFDFGKYAHLARGGVVSTEWTAQMVVSFKIMMDYHRNKGDFEKADFYKRKRDFYLSELGKMVISSSSRLGQGEGCLPYASQDDVDTGHGWRVTSGSKTGSTAGTTYTIFAKYNYNPLMLK